MILVCGIPGSQMKVVEGDRKSHRVLEIECKGCASPTPGRGENDVRSSSRTNETACDIQCTQCNPRGSETLLPPEPERCDEDAKENRT